MSKVPQAHEGFAVLLNVFAVLMMRREPMTLMLVGARQGAIHFFFLLDLEVDLLLESWLLQRLRVYSQSMVHGSEPVYTPMHCLEAHHSDRHPHYRYGM